MAYVDTVGHANPVLGARTLVQRMLKARSHAFSGVGRRMELVADVCPMAGTSVLCEPRSHRRAEHGLVSGLESTVGSRTL